MKRLIFVVLSVGLFVAAALVTPAFAAPPTQKPDPKIEQNIVLSLPESALAQALAAVTPFSFNSASKMIRGTITVRAIRNLRLGNNHVQARLDLAGSNLEVVTELAGQQLRMKVGEAALAAEVLAERCCDAKRQILYIKPIIDQAQRVEGNEVGRGLVDLFNNQEFPVSMRSIQPFTAEVGGKTIAIATTVADVRALPQKLELSLTPRITSRVGK
ncbi:MAG: hypothetical protein LBH14_06665 [Desulfobulbaceae bacterium]|nr:hypothetical protein [Desulfobulbaceae bacterium]